MTQVLRTHKGTNLLSIINDNNNGPEVFEFAQDYGLPHDPNRMEAANVDDWNYGRGNPPNPITGVVDISLRPNNATGFVFNTFIYVMFKGVSLIYVCNFDRILLNDEEYTNLRN